MKTMVEDFYNDNFNKLAKRIVRLLRCIAIVISALATSFYIQHIFPAVYSYLYAVLCGVEVNDLFGWYVHLVEELGVMILSCSAIGLLSCITLFILMLLVKCIKHLLVRA